MIQRAFSSSSRVDFSSSRLFRKSRGPCLRGPLADARMPLRHPFATYVTSSVENSKRSSDKKALLTFTLSLLFLICDSSLYAIEWQEVKGDHFIVYYVQDEAFAKSEI